MEVPLLIMGALEQRPDFFAAVGRLPIVCLCSIGTAAYHFVHRTCSERLAAEGCAFCCIYWWQFACSAVSADVTVPCGFVYCLSDHIKIRHSTGNRLTMEESQFIKLPTEICNQIYELALGRITIDREHFGNPYSYLPDTDGFHSAHPLALTMVCEKLRERQIECSSTSTLSLPWEPSTGNSTQPSANSGDE